MSRHGSACRHGDRPHAPHLDWATGPRCPGVEPFPHRAVRVWWGSWRWLTRCSCGGVFEEDDWQEHEAEHGRGPAGPVPHQLQTRGLR